MTRKLMVAAGGLICAAPLLAALWSAAPASASTAWRVQQVPAPANSSTQLQAVSCPAADVCTAVGSSVGLTTNLTSALAERWSGGQWVIQPTPSPAGSSFTELTGVSCLSATDCTAVGIAGTQTPAESTLVEHWDGTSWTVVPSPDPAAGATTTDFTSVSCASTTSCTAVGVYVISGNRSHELPFAEHWDGTSWAVTPVPLPAGVTTAELEGGVSCPSPTDCIAVGASATPDQPSNIQPLAERWNGTRWTVQATPIPAGAVNPGFNGVSCTSPTHCTAVGGYFANGTADTPLAERWDGTAWTIQTDNAASTGLASVSCTSTTSCTAIGQAVAEQWDGTSWTSQPLPIPHHAFRFAMSDVSCVSAGTCTVVGSYGRIMKPLAEHE
jgi:hypothetical protein